MVSLLLVGVLKHPFQMHHTRLRLEVKVEIFNLEGLLAVCFLFFYFNRSLVRLLYLLDRFGKVAFDLDYLVAVVDAVKEGIFNFVFMFYRGHSFIAFRGLGSTGSEGLEGSGSHKIVVIHIQLLIRKE